MATFKREWFKSETDYVKANYLVGHNPKVKLSEIATTYDDIKFKNGNFSKLIIDEKIGYWTAYEADTLDCQKIEFARVFWHYFMKGANVKHVINVNGKTGHTGSCFQIPNLLTFEANSLGVWADSICYDCNKLKSFIAKDASLAENLSLVGCTALEKIILTGIVRSFDIHYSTALSEQALIELFNSIGVVTTTQTITLGSTLLAKLTDEDKKIATDKGWTLA